MKKRASVHPSRDPAGSSSDSVPAFPVSSWAAAAAVASSEL